MPTLTRILAVRTVLVAVGVSLLLTAFVFARYTLDTPNLRRATLELDVQKSFASCAKAPIRPACTRTASIRITTDFAFSIAVCHRPESWLRRPIRSCFPCSGSLRPRRVR